MNAFPLRTCTGGHIAVTRKHDIGRDIRVFSDMMFGDVEGRSKMPMSAFAPGLHSVSGRRLLLVAKYKRTAVSN
jgi:hypothetical protein